MQLNEFIKRLFVAAKDAGIDPAEAYIVQNDSFEAATQNQEIISYSSNSTSGVGFRGMLGGRMGYASTEATDEDAVAQLVRGVRDSALLCEDDAEQFIYSGTEKDPEVSTFNPALENVTPEQKLGLILQMERIAQAYDPRIAQVGDTTVMTGKGTVRLVNSYGLDKTYTSNECGACLQPVAKDGDSTATSFTIAMGRDFAALNPETIAKEAAQEAVSRLHAEQVPSGAYPVIILNRTMCDLLRVFDDAFSAEIAQEGKSLLKGKLGQTIAADCVSIVDDPLMEDGPASRPFDGEGVPSGRHVVVENGVFRLFLQSLKTAKKDGVPTTGNASRRSYASVVTVAPTNFYMEKGALSLEELMAQMGDGLLITNLDGLHSGTDSVSGDFSLLAKGYQVKAGRKAGPVEQITVAGNFLQMLKDVVAVGSDLSFPMGGYGAPSVLISKLSVAGK